MPEKGFTLSFILLPGVASLSHRALQQKKGAPDQGPLNTGNAATLRLVETTAHHEHSRKFAGTFIYRGHSMTAIRSFIAIDLNAEVQSKLGEVIRQLKPGAGIAVRWVPENNIHITLKFLGDTSPANLDILKKILTTEASRVQPFALKIDGLGAFPSIRRPRVIWIGVEAPPALLALQRSIDTETQRLGYTPEDRPFSPHLTLGRILHNATPEDIRKVGDLLVASKISITTTVLVKTVVLFRSDLQPGGAIYTPIHTAPLKNAA